MIGNENENTKSKTQRKAHCKILSGNKEKSCANSMVAIDWNTYIFHIIATKYAQKNTRKNNIPKKL